MAPPPSTGRRSIGNLTARPEKDDGLVPRTLVFVRDQLPQWRDDPRRVSGENEKALNSSLSDFLDSRSRSLLPMVRFKHEAPQSRVHAVDIGAHIAEGEALIAAVPYSYSIYEPFLVIEAKRLPAPDKRREREYVTGGQESTGGIQRFKLGLHGHRVTTGSIVGYIEDHTATHWHRMINGWIMDLAAGQAADGCAWNAAEVLRETCVDEQLGTASAVSTHARPASCLTEEISLHHLWVDMAHPKASVGAAETAAPEVD